MIDNFREMNDKLAQMIDKTWEMIDNSREMIDNFSKQQARGASMLNYIQKGELE